VLMLLLIGVGRSRSGGPTIGRAAAAREAHRSYGKGCWGGRKPNCKGRGAPADHGGAKAALDWGSGGVCDEDINYNTSTSTPAAPFLATPDAPPPQAPPPSGSITRARARELNFVMLLKNEGPEE
jgi:hypothetical protein